MTIKEKDFRSKRTKMEYIFYGGPEASDEIEIAVVTLKLMWTEFKLPWHFCATVIFFFDPSIR